MAGLGMREAFWNGKTVLVTGHTGFKGSWLSLWLQAMGSKLIGYALEPPTDPSLFTKARVDDGMVSVMGDVRDLDHLVNTIARYKPEVVFNLAAQALVRLSYEDPITTYTTNVIGTANLLEAVRRTKTARVVVCITSDKCYQNEEWVWGYREYDRLGGYDPYSSSKGCAELVIAAYRNSYFPPSESDHHGVALASARAGNVIGGGDWAQDRLIPDILKAILEGRPVVIRSPHAIRPWQHVLEPLNGYLMLAEQMWEKGAPLSQAWNFGPSSDEAKNVLWIVQYLIDAWGDDASWILDSNPQPHEDTYLKLDCSKARSLIGWAPRLSLSTALNWIVEWYQAYQRNRDMQRITLDQIASYNRERHR